MPTLQFNVNDTTRTGYWSPSTSSVDWCELNYVHTQYIAETVNTLSAFVYIYGAYLFNKQLRYVKVAPTRFYLVNIIFLAVALGTILFHSTLKRSAQLFDEFPMIYGMAIVFYCALCNKQNTPTAKKIMAGTTSFLFSFSVTITMIFKPNNPTFFFVSFSIIMTIVFFMVIKRASQFPGGLGLWFSGAGFVLGSLALWMIENFHCQRVINFYFHSLWHLGSCVGIYRFGVLVLLIYLKFNNYKFHFNDKGIHFLFPRLIKIRK
eukprot:gene8674-621_t